MNKDELKFQATYDAKKKNILLAYLFWFFLGGFGAHRFYLNQPYAVWMLVLTIASIILSVFGIGAIGLLAVGIWCIVDAFKIPGIVEQKNLELVDQLTA